MTWRMERQIGRLHRERRVLDSLICLQLIKEKRKGEDKDMPKYVIEREIRESEMRRTRRS